MTKSERITKHENRRSEVRHGLFINSFAPDFAEDQMQFFGFLPKNAGLGFEVRLRGGRHAQEELRFASLLATGADLVLEILPRHSVVGFAIIGTNTGSGANQLF